MIRQEHHEKGTAVSKTYQSKSVGASAPAEVPLPEQVTIALGEIVESARGGLLALAVGAGLQVMRALMADQLGQPQAGGAGRRAGGGLGGAGPTGAAGASRGPDKRASTRWDATARLLDRDREIPRGRGRGRSPRIRRSRPGLVGWDVERG